MVAKQIAVVNGEGISYRYGGEKFCVIFSGKDIEQYKKTSENSTFKRRRVQHDPA